MDSPLLMCLSCLWASSRSSVNRRRCRNSRTCQIRVPRAASLSGVSGGSAGASWLGLEDQMAAPPPPLVHLSSSSPLTCQTDPAAAAGS